MLTRAIMLSSRGRPLAIAGRTFRPMSTEAPAAAARPASRGSSFLQRLSSFLAGVGLASGIGFYFLLQDVQRSTEFAKASLQDISKRLDALEKK